MTLLKVVEKDGIEPIQVKAATLDGCISILVEKGMIDLRKFMKPLAPLKKAIG